MNQVSARGRMLGLITAFYASQAIYCAAELEIPDKLKDGAKDAEELARLCGCSADHLDRVLRALATAGVLKEVDGRYELTPLSECMLRDAANSVWPIAVFHGREIYGAAGQLLETVRTGRSAWEGGANGSFWQYLSRHPERGDVFDTMMQSIHGAESAAIADAYDFSGARTVVDVGGGNGSMLNEILARNPKVRGVLFDRPDVVERVSESGDAILSQRCELKGGSFFDELPRDGDIYVMRHILHDWLDPQAVQILNVCRSAMPASATLIVIETLLDRASQAAMASWSDLGLMVCGGRERTTGEYHRLFEEAGFIPGRVLQTPAPVCVLEAVPAA